MKRGELQRSFIGRYFMLSLLAYAENLSVKVSFLLRSPTLNKDEDSIL